MGETVAPQSLAQEARHLLATWLQQQVQRGRWQDDKKTTEETLRKAITSAISSQLSHPDFTRLLHGAGILGAAPLMARVWEQGTVFFSEPKDSEVDPYRTPYLDPDSPIATIHPLGEAILQPLFRAFRSGQQSRRQGSIHNEDFYYWLPTTAGGDNNDLYFACEPEAERRRISGVHYCTVGEILFTLLAWRLSMARDQSCRTLKSKVAGITESVLGVLTAAESQGFTASQKELLDKVFGPKTLGAILQDLCILSIEGGAEKLALWGPCVLEFVWSTGLAAGERPTEIEACAAVLLDAVSKFRDRIGGEEAMVGRARFPHLPYYFWVANDGAPRCYLVVPSWTSPQYPVIRERPGALEEKTAITGLAIAAVSPLDPFDWTLQGTAARSHPAVRSINIGEVINLLLAICQPAVETLYYRQLHSKLMELRRREVLSAILARNLSHNVGSHVLANPTLLDRVSLLSADTDGGGVQLRRRQMLQTFVGYIQKRLDFIARMLSRTRQPPEPLFFFSDVLFPFLRQNLLLDTLLDDLGFGGQRLSVIVTQIDDSGQRRSVFDHPARAKLSNSTDQKPELAPGGALVDFLVGIPGGSVGTHALYAVFENILRNSAKYGERLVEESDRPEQLELRLDLSKDNNGRWVLDIHDNLSEEPRKGEKHLRDINERMASDAVEQDGSQTGHSHGIYEIRECCNYLRGNTGFDGLASDSVLARHFENPEPGRPVRVGFRLVLDQPILLGYHNLRQTVER